MNSRQLTKYVVLSVVPLLLGSRACAKKRGNDRRPRLAECVVAREGDLGVCDQQFNCISHLGYILCEGDIVLGYDLTSASWTTDANLSKKFDIPDVVLVRKYYGSEGARKWALKNLEVEHRQELNSSEVLFAEKDYEEFMQEIEGDKEMRTKINVYKSQVIEARAKPASRKDFKHDDAAASMEAENDSSFDDEQIRLEELLDDLVIERFPDDENVILPGDPFVSKTTHSVIDE